MSSDKDNSQQKIICKNCSIEFKGNFCPNCGQSIKEYNRPISFLIVDMLGTFFAFDTRFWNTFGSLVLKPGKYANEYLAGHRARFAPPFRVYLFISLAFFLLLTSFINNNLEVSEEFRSDLKKSLDREVMQDSSGQELIDSGDLNIKLSGPEDQKENLAQSIKTMVANPQIYISSFLRFFSWSLFFLMPVYAAILWLFFRSTRQYYFGHLVFSLNQHALIFLVFSILLTIKLIFPEKGHNYENFLAIYIPIYLFLGSRKLYANSWLKTFFKMFLAWILYLLVLAFAIGIVILTWYRFEF